MIHLVDKFTQRNAHLGYEQPAPSRTWAADHEPQAPSLRVTSAFQHRLSQMARFIERHLR